MDRDVDVVDGDGDGDDGSVLECGWFLVWYMNSMASRHHCIRSRLAMEDEDVPAAPPPLPDSWVDWLRRRMPASLIEAISTLKARRAK